MKLTHTPFLSLNIGDIFYIHDAIWEKVSDSSGKWLAADDNRNFGCCDFINDSNPGELSEWVQVCTINKEDIAKLLLTHIGSTNNEILD